MNSLLFLLIGFFLAAPAEAKPSLEQLVVDLEKYSSTEDWIANYPHLSSLERKMLLGSPNLPAEIPSILIEKVGPRTYLVVEPLRVDVTQLSQGILFTGGRKIEFNRRQPLLHLAAQLAQRPEQRAHLEFLLQLLTPVAHAEMSDVCLGKYEFLLRSPYGILDSKAGYLPHLLIAGLGLGFLRTAVDSLRFCETHVRDLNKILREKNLGIKEIDCGEEESGSDRSIEFWIPERDEAGEFKTKKFNLDYSILVAHEEPEEEKEEEGEEVIRETAKGKGKEKEKEKEKAKKPKKPKVENYFIFSTSGKLQEVRQLSSNSIDNHYQCTSSKKGAPDFSSLAAIIKPFEGVMGYIGNYESCTACKKELLLRVRSVEAPSYFPPLPAPKVEEKVSPPKGKARSGSAAGAPATREKSGAAATAR
jgi:hypothetical protein